MRVRKFGIKSMEETLEDARKVFHLAMQGKGKKVSGMEVFFESVDAMRAVLTTERINLLKAIRIKKPKSIYELAKITKRDFKNVFQDVNRLADMGLIDLKTGTDARRSKKPVLTADCIQVEIII